MSHLAGSSWQDRGWVSHLAGSHSWQDRGWVSHLAGSSVSCATVARTVIHSPVPGDPGGNEHARTTRRTARRRTCHRDTGPGRGPLLREHGCRRDQGRTAHGGREPLSPGRQLRDAGGRRALLAVPRHEQDQALRHARPPHGTRAVGHGEAARGRRRVPHQRPRGGPGTYGPRARGPDGAISQARRRPRQRVRPPRGRGGQGDAGRGGAGARRDREHERAAWERHPRRRAARSRTMPGPCNSPSVA